MVSGLYFSCLFFAGSAPSHQCPPGLNETKAGCSYSVLRGWAVTLFFLSWPEEVFLTGKFLPDSEWCRLGGWDDTGKVKLSSFPSWAIRLSFWFYFVAQTSSVDSRGLWVLFWFVLSCLAIDTGREVEGAGFSHAAIFSLAILQPPKCAQCEVELLSLITVLASNWHWSLHYSLNALYVVYMLVFNVQWWW